MLKKLPSVKRIENLRLSQRDLIDRELDKGAESGDIVRKVRAEDGTRLEPKDIEDYATWRELSANSMDVSNPDGITGAETPRLPKTLLLPQIIEVMDEKATKLMIESRDNPSSDATKIIESLLVQQMTAAFTQSAENDLKTSVELQRKHKAAEYKAINERKQRLYAEKLLVINKKELKVKTQQLEDKKKELAQNRDDMAAERKARAEQTVAQTRLIEAQTRQMEAKTKTIEAVAETTKRAAAAQVEGKPWDNDELVTVIRMAFARRELLLELRQKGG